QPLGGILENPRRLARLRVADDDAPCGFGSLLRNPSQLQRQGIRQGRVTVVAADEDGVVGRDRIDHPARGQLRIWPRFFVPVASLDPLAGRKRFRLLSQAPHKLGLVGSVFQVNFEKLEASRHEVYVIVDEAWNGEAPLEINHSRVGTNIAPNLVAAPHGQDAAARYRYGLYERGRDRFLARTRVRLARPDFA